MILYFTGTGNSRWVATRLARALHDEVLNLSDFLKPEIEEPAGVKDAEMPAGVKKAEAPAALKNTEETAGVKDAETPAAVTSVLTNAEEPASLKTAEMAAAATAVLTKAENPASLKNTEEPAGVRKAEISAEMPAGVKNAEAPAALKNTEMPAGVGKAEISAETPAGVKNAENPASLKNTEEPAGVKNAETPAAAIAALKNALLEAECVGLVFPIHGWCAPRVLVRFVQQLQLPRCRYCYAVCTCGDDAGKALNRLSRRFQLDAAWSVVMPNTYIPMFSLDDDDLCRRKVARACQTIDAIAAAVQARRHVWQVHEGTAAWLKTYVVNPLFVRFIISHKGFHVDAGCQSCGKCVAGCPVGNLRLKDGRPVWGENCIHCMACVHGCPARAIQYRKATQTKGRYRLSAYTDG